MSKPTNLKLITGATGNVGGLVVDQLLARGERPRVLVRDRAKAVARWGERVELAVGDLADPEAVRAALAGVAAVFLVTSGEALADLDALAADAARSAGTPLLVKLSSLDANERIGTGVWHAQGEAAIRARGVPFTFVQPSGFMSNALYWARGIVADGVVRSCTGDGAIPFVHPADIAGVALAALDGAHPGASLPLTGPAALTYAEMTAAIGDALGRPLRWVAISEDEARAQQRAWNAPPAMLEARLSIFRGIREGRLAAVTPTVERILGRPPRPFAHWVAENVAAFR